MRKMTGPETVGSVIIGTAALTRVVRYGIQRVREYLDARRCPHPEHRVYVVTEYWCAECNYPVNPIIEYHDHEN